MLVVFIICVLFFLLYLTGIRLSRTKTQRKTIQFISISYLLISICYYCYITDTEKLKDYIVARYYLEINHEQYIIKHAPLSKIYRMSIN